MQSKLKTAMVGALFSVAAMTSVAQAASDSELAAAKAWTQKNLPGIPDAVVDGAAKEGQVMFYHLLTVDIDKLFKAFTNRYPFIKVQEFMASGGPLIERFRVESRSQRPIADVVQDSSYDSTLLMSKDHLLMKFTPPTDGRIAPQWKVQDYSYPIGLFNLSVAWNPDVVTPDEQKKLASLKTWDEFFATKWTSKIGIVALAAGGTTELFYYYLWKAHGDKDLKTLGQAHPLQFDSIVPLGERLASGEVGIGVPVLDTGISGQYLKGIPVNWVYPEPVLAGAAMQFISAIAPHPNAAKLFQAWSMSPEGLGIWAQIKGYTIPLKNATDTRPVTKEKWFKAPSDNVFPVAPGAIKAAMPQVSAAVEANMKK